MNNKWFTISPVAECALMLHFDDVISEQQIGLYAGAIGQQLQMAVMNVVPAYHTILVEYLPFRLDEVSIILTIEKLLNEIADKRVATSSQHHVIPVLYSEETALDLPRFVEKGVHLEHLISLHTTPCYSVSAIGFTPGFAFLSDVDERISLPRLSSPRLQVPKGSVAIADNKTAIYPSATPGGWNIIGRTPLEVYQPNYIPITPFNIGDTVAFKAISEKEFLNLGGML
ncbi:allophanate hydrolase subunit 1 [Vibrio vulnificus]|nr:allophanate hydrolase subunit 1 [Vibrio vulnificus]